MRIALLVLLPFLVSGCAFADQSGGPQGPTGVRERSAPITLESYLIPPEIPSSLVSYLLQTKPENSEIVSIGVLAHLEKKWTIEISLERLPAETFREVIEFVKSGESWREV